MPCVYLPGPAPAVTVANTHYRSISQIIQQHVILSHSIGRDCISKFNLKNCSKEYVAEVTLFSLLCCQIGQKTRNRVFYQGVLPTCSIQLFCLPVLPKCSAYLYTQLFFLPALPSCSAYLFTQLFFLPFLPNCCAYLFYLAVMPICSTQLFCRAVLSSCSA